MDPCTTYCAICSKSGRFLSSRFSSSLSWNYPHLPRETQSNDHTKEREDRNHGGYAHCGLIRIKMLETLNMSDDKQMPDQSRQKRNQGEIDDNLTFFSKSTKEDGRDTAANDQTKEVSNFTICREYSVRRFHTKEDDIVRKKVNRLCLFGVRSDEGFGFVFIFTERVSYSPVKLCKRSNPITKVFQDFVQNHQNFLMSLACGFRLAPLQTGGGRVVIDRSQACLFAIHARMSAIDSSVAR